MIKSGGREVEACRRRTCERRSPLVFLMDESFSIGSAFFGGLVAERN